MTLQWNAPVTADFWDAYLDWSRLLQTRRAALLPPDPDGHDWFEPVFVRLKPQGKTAMASARKALAARVDDPDDPLVMDPLDYARLSARIADSSVDAGLPDEYALYRRLGGATPGDAALFDVLDVGSTVDLDLNDTPDATAAPQQPKPWHGTPIVAIIDDGIGFLNSRFRRATPDGYETRVHAIWLQSLERLRMPAGGQRRAHLGRILSGDEIDALLAQGRALDEPATYAALNADLYGRGGHRSTEFGQSHGTHVLDLAAGADPDDASDPARDWPLLAVQLPPEAIEDTSGTRFESYMVQGLRWILKQAQGMDPKAPVIVNLSMGMQAGPKNGTRFAEYQIAREARLWEQVTGQPVRIVWSFGNNWRSRQVAAFDFPRTAAPRDATDRQITWRAQPDDLTASYLEVHCDAGTDSTMIEVALTAPDGTASGFVPMAPGSFRSLDAKGPAVARIYHVPEHVLEPGIAQPACYMLALGPTNARIAGEALAPSGAWSVAIRYRGVAPMRLSLQIQRGESLPGYAPRGRQSYFDDATAYAWDGEQQDWSGLATDCPIRRDGTLSALATGLVRQVHSVGAAEWDACAVGYRPSPYTSQGTDWTAKSPIEASTRADDGRVLWGVLASGTFSESARLLNGTSAAAGRLTRALAYSHKKIIANAAQGGGRQFHDLDPKLLDLHPVPAEHAARLGLVVVNMTEGARPRS